MPVPSRSSASTVRSPEEPASGPDSSLKGRVDFPANLRPVSPYEAPYQVHLVLGSFKLQQDLAAAAINADGSFRLLPPWPEKLLPGQTFRLEVTRQHTQIGDENPSLYSYARWTGAQWESVSRPGILINTSSTALVVIQSLSEYFHWDGLALTTPPALIGLLRDQSRDQDWSVAARRLRIDATAIEQAEALTRQLLADSKEPVYHLGWNGQNFELSKQSPIQLSTAIPYKAPSDEIITTVAGNGAFLNERTSSAGLFAGDGGPAVEASLNTPSDVFIDPVGNLYIADTGNHRIRKVDPEGIITTVAGSGVQGFSGDGGPATQAALNAPRGVFVDQGQIFIADSFNHRIRKIDRQGVISTLAGDGFEANYQGKFSGDQGPGPRASLNNPADLYGDGQGNLYIADTDNHRIRKLDPDGIITTVAGNSRELDEIGFLKGGSTGDGGLATRAQLNYPSGIYVDRQGQLFITDRGNGKIRKVDEHGIITTLVGNGGNAAVDMNPNNRQESSQAALISLYLPEGTVLVDDGQIYLSDSGAHAIRSVSSDGSVKFLATGYGSSGLGDGGPANWAQLSFPNSMCLDRDGNLYFAEGQAHRIRKITRNRPLALKPPVVAASAKP
ncbi:MAG: NHL repeat-containing protein [Candidatus Sericytochromatia bacterium]